MMLALLVTEQIYLKKMDGNLKIAPTLRKLINVVRKIRTNWESVSVVNEYVASLSDTLQDSNLKLLMDHKPRMSLIDKQHLYNITLRWQSLLMRLRRYNPVAKRVPGKDTSCVWHTIKMTVCSCFEYSCHIFSDKYSVLYAGVEKKMREV